MSQIVTLHKICAQCSGTGVSPNSIGGEPGPGIDPCPWPGCNGDGYVEYGKFVLELDEDLEDKINDILDKCNDILEKISE